MKNIQKNIVDAFFFLIIIGFFVFDALFGKEKHQND